MTTLKIRMPYDPSVRTCLSFDTQTRTKQSFKAECDINNIMTKYAKTGVLEHTRNVQGAYGDFSNVPDFQEAQNRIIQAQEAFMALPAAIRKRFDNDPGQLMDFVNDPDNLEEAVKLGLAQEPEKPSQPDPSPTARQSKRGDPKGGQPPSANPSDGNLDNASDD